MQAFAFFDFDKTLTAGDTLFPYLLYLRKTKIISRAQLGKAMLAGLLYILGLLDERRAKQMALSFVRDLPQAVLEQSGRAFLRSLRIFEGAKEEIAVLRARGLRIVVVSASCDIYMQYIRDVLPVDDLLCTRVEHGVVQENCKGREKVRRIQEFLAQQGEELDAGLSCAYGDSRGDLHMMSLVRQRVIVNNRALYHRQDSALYRFVEWR